MSTTTEKIPPRFDPVFQLWMLGSSAPVFPGFEVDILDRVPDSEREDAVFSAAHIERAIRADLAPLDDVLPVGVW